MFFAKKCLFFFVSCRIFIIFASHTKKKDTIIMQSINKKMLKKENHF